MLPVATSHPIFTSEDLLTNLGLYQHLIGAATPRTLPGLFPFVHHDQVVLPDVARDTKSFFSACELPGSLGCGTSADDRGELSKPLDDSEAASHEEP